MSWALGARAGCLAAHHTGSAGAARSVSSARPGWPRCTLAAPFGCRILVANRTKGSRSQVSSTSSRSASSTVCCPNATPCAALRSARKLRADRCPPAIADEAQRFPVNIAWAVVDETRFIRHCATGRSEAPHSTYGGNIRTRLSPSGGARGIHFTIAECDCNATQFGVDRWHGRAPLERIADNINRLWVVRADQHRRQELRDPNGRRLGISVARCRSWS